jgi:hypothetical protein
VQGWWQNPPGSFVLAAGGSVLAVGRGIIGFGGVVIALGRGIISAGRPFLGVCGVGLRKGRTIIKAGTVILVLSKGIIGDVARAGCEDKATVQRDESMERKVMKTKSKAGGFVLSACATNRQPPLRAANPSGVVGISKRVNPKAASPSR